MIRPLNESDIPQLLDVALPWQGPQFFWPEKQLRDEFAAAETYGFFEGSQLQAFAMLCDRHVAWELTCLATRKNCQRRGCMGQLLQFLIDQRTPLKELWLEVHENNIAARYLYEKLGFVQVHTRASYYGDGAAAILYTKKVG